MSFPIFRHAAGMGVMAVFCAWSSTLIAQAPPPGPQDPSTGDAARLYRSACAPCHGRLGDGNSPAARLLGTPQPRDFTTGVFKFRSTPTGALPSDDDLYRNISRGVQGTWMPAWESHLSESERWGLVRYVKGFSERFTEEVPERPIDIPPPPEESQELVEQGRLVYAVLQCWQCHGMDGRGDGPSADDLTDDRGRDVKAYDFTRGGFKNGDSPAAVYRTLVTGLDGTPMPAFEIPVVAFAADDVDATVLERPLGEEGLRALQRYLAGQPTTSQLQAKSADEVERLGQQRLWALVYYLRSLERPRGGMYWLFADRPEPVSRARRDQ